MDINSQIEQYTDLLNGISDISGSIGTIVLVLGLGTLIVLPIILYLKYKMEVKIVKKGTLQALQEFYNPKPIPIKKDNHKDNKNKDIVSNINKDEIL